jgi:hypothetical protein
VHTFQCYSTEGKVVVVLTWCASLFSAVFFPFKVWSAYKYRRGKLEAKGVRPTLKHLVFFRTALARAVSLQPLIGYAGGGDFDTKPPPPSWKASSASGGGASEAAQAADLLHSSQTGAMLRMNADLQEKLLEQERKTKEQDQRMKELDQRMKEQDQRMKEQDQRMKEQERTIAALQQSAPSPRPVHQRDDA